MATTKITPKDFVEALKEWSVLDVVEAVKAIEEEFGIKAVTAVAAPAGPAGPAQAGEAPAEEQTEVTVGLSGGGGRKINEIKAVGAPAPRNVLENVSKEDAEKGAARLREAGATADVK